LGHDPLSSVTSLILDTANSDTWAQALASRKDYYLTPPCAQIIILYNYGGKLNNKIGKINEFFVRHHSNEGKEGE